MNRTKEYSDLELLNIKKEDKIYSIKEIKNLTSDLFEKYNFERVYIFGSYARNQANEESDIDIMTFGDDAISYILFSEFVFELVKVLKKEVDVIREENYINKAENEFFELANKIFYNQICSERILIYEKSK